MNKFDFKLSKPETAFFSGSNKFYSLFFGIGIMKIKVVISDESFSVFIGYHC